MCASSKQGRSVCYVSQSAFDIFDDLKPNPWQRQPNNPMPINFESHVPSWWVEKPTTKEEYASSFVEKEMERFSSHLNDLRNNFPDYNLGFLINYFSLNFSYAWLYHGKELIYNYFYYLNQLRLAWFQYTMNEGKSITLTLVHRQIKTIGRFENHHISASDVTEGVQTSLLTRDRSTLDYFAHIPVNFTDQSNQDDLIVEIVMAFYQLLAKEKATANDARAAFHTLSQQLDWNTYQRYVAVEGFNQSWVWERIFAGRKEYAEYVSLPVLNIYYQILENNLY